MRERSPQSYELFAPDKGTPQGHRDERVQEALDILEQSIDNTLDSDTFRSYLQAMSAFHDYSYNNVLLIMMQRPDAERVAGFNTWKLLGRNVKKRPPDVPDGKWGIKIITPCFRYEWREDEETGEKKGVEILTGFGTGTVFDIKQTEGKPLPAPPAAWTLQSESDVTRGLYRYLSDYAVDRGARSVTRQGTDRLGRSNGFYVPQTNEIVVSTALKADAASRTSPASR